MSVKDNFPTTRPSLLLDFANTKVLDPRVTFSRASTATFYDGKTVAKAEENLLTYSQEFDNAAWSKFNTTVTANATTAPDGTTTADKLTENTSNNFHSMDSQLLTGTGVYTSSVYVKPDGRNLVRLYLTKPGVSYTALFDISAGTIDSFDAGVTASITPSTNGFYRIAVTVTLDGAQVRTTVLMQNATGAAAAYTGDGTSGIYIWGAQLEQRSTVTAYTPTTTQPITNYIPVLQTASANVARFDHNPVTGESLGLRVEEQRTNLALYSQEFDNAAWTKAKASIFSNAIVAPDGTLTGDKIIENTESGAHGVYLAPSVLPATSHTASIYAKAAERSWIFFNGGGSGDQPCYFDLTNGAIGSLASGRTATITPVGNGWYRCSVTFTAINSSQYNNVWYATTGNNVTGYVGNGFSGIYIWGAQLEAGSFATSYIKTEASQVTRSADSASMTGTNFSSWYRQDEGTIYCDVDHTRNSGNLAFTFVAIGNTTSTESITITSKYGTSIPPYASAYVVANNATQANIERGPLAFGTIKSAFSYKFNDFAFCANASAVATDTSGVVPTPTQLIIGGKPSAYSDFALNSTIKKLAYYPARLTNTQLQALTQG